MTNYYTVLQALQPPPLGVVVEGGGAQGGRGRNSTRENPHACTQAPGLRHALSRSFPPVHCPLFLALSPSHAQPCSSRRARPRLEGSPRISPTGASVTVAMTHRPKRLCGRSWCRRSWPPVCDGRQRGQRCGEACLLWRRAVQVRRRCATRPRRSALVDRGACGIRSGARVQLGMRTGDHDMVHGLACK